MFLIKKSNTMSTSTSHSSPSIIFAFSADFILLQHHSVRILIPFSCCSWEVRQSYNASGIDLFEYISSRWLLLYIYIYIYKAQDDNPSMDQDYRAAGTKTVRRINHGGL